MANDDGPPLFIAFNPKTSNRCEKKTLTSEREFHIVLMHKCIQY